MHSYLKDGILDIEEIKKPTEEQLKKGVAIIECIQEIPCNPCVDSCPVNAITMKDINAPPVVDYDKCIACGKCVGICPGLAIFVVKIKDDIAYITLPYEMLPIPEKNQEVEALNRKGEVVAKATVVKVLKAGKTMVITIKTKKELAMIVRNIKV